MSWHFSAKGDDTESLDKELDIHMPTSQIELEKQQMGVAKDLALGAIESGEFGNGPYTVVLSGHGKRGNTDVHGNTLSISIHSKT